MNEHQYRAMLEATARRMVAAKVPNILDDPDVFRQQREFILDPAKLKALFCTRRAAKSFTAGLYLVHEALTNPGCNCLFIGLTRDSAKEIIWKDILKVIDYKYGLGARPNLTELTLTFPNGSVIKITGVDADESEMRKLLGKKYRVVCIDESSMYTVNLSNLVYGVLKPAMADERGQICLMGTASDFPQGLFYDVTTGKEGGWRLFEWSAHDNPHVARQWQEELDEIERDRPLYKETPQYKQWYLNQWVIDEEKLCYGFSAAKNVISIADWKAAKAKLNPTRWTRVLGGDTGWEDDNALVLTEYHESQAVLYVPRSWAKKRLTFDEFADRIDSEYIKSPEIAPHRVIIDGANKQGVESMRMRRQIPFEYADKQDKATFIELCKSDMIQAKIKIVDTPENRPFMQEIAALVWFTQGGKIKLPKKEHPSLPNHRCDAFLYAWRAGFHYSSIPEKKLVTKYSPEWYQQQAENIWEKEKEKLIREESETTWPDQGGWGD